MKNGLFWITILISNFSIAQSKWSLLKLNSFEFSGVIQSFSNNSSNKLNYYFVNPLESIEPAQTSSIWSNRSTFSNPQFSVGFTPYSKSKGEYKTNQELIFNIGYADRLSLYSYGSVNSNYRVDTLYSYHTTTSSPDTIATASYVDSVFSNSQNTIYQFNWFSIGAEWFFRSSYGKRSTFGIAPGFRANFSFNPELRSSRRKSYYLTSNNIFGNTTGEISSSNSFYEAKNNVTLQPYMAFLYEFRLGLKDNFLQPLSLTAKGSFGFSSIFVKDAPVYTDVFYSGAFGLRYIL